jgi:hypothetical protein
LRRILKSYADYYNGVRTHRSEQRCAGLSPASADWNHSFTPDTRRASSPLRPGLSFRYTQPSEPRKLVQMQGRDVLCAPYDKLCLVDRKYEDVLNFGVDQLNRTVARRDVKVTQTETLRRTRLPATQ